MTEEKAQGEELKDVIDKNRHHGQLRYARVLADALCKMPALPDVRFWSRADRKKRDATIADRAAILQDVDGARLAYLSGTLYQKICKKAIVMYCRGEEPK